MHLQFLLALESDPAEDEEDMHDQLAVHSEFGSGSMTGSHVNLEFDIQPSSPSCLGVRTSLVSR